MKVLGKISDTGIRPEQEKLIREVLNECVGIFIVASPGHAQGTAQETIQFLLNNCFSGENINIEKVQGRDQDEFDRSFLNSLRNDPDIVVLDEIKGSQELKAMTDSALSGHQVLTTVSSASAFSVFKRLETLGVDRELLGNPHFINGILYQIPVVKLTPENSITFEEYQKRPEAKQKVIDCVNEVFMPDEIANIRFRKSDENRFSNETFLIAEYLKVTPKLREMIANNKFDEALEHHIQNGAVSIDIDGKMIYSGLENINISALEAIKNGFCDIREINKKLSIFGDLENED
ncbi:ATPase, T2SS/T4P/T4SS family [Vibrio parahaemolyticus]